METTKTLTTKTLFKKPLALTHFYLKVYPQVEYYVLKRKGSIEDAEDIFQEAVFLLLEKDTDNPLSLTKDTNAYFFGICKNLWSRQLRKRKQNLELHVLENMCEDDAKEIHTIDQQQKDKLFESHFIKLNTTAKRIWNLCFEGNSNSEISGLTGWSDAYIRRKKSEAKKSLTQMIRQDPLFNEFQDVNPAL